MKIINVSVRDKIASAVGDIVYICGNSDYVINFDFDAEWDDYDVKTARFVHDGSYIDVVFTGNQCAMPVIHKAYGIYVGVYAGDLRTTTPAHIPSAASILSADGTPDEPPDDVYAQITALCNEAVSEAKSVREDADAGKFDGAPGKSAYQYAKDGGYTGTETKFATKLAQEQLTGTTNDLTPTQVYDAVSAGIPVKVQHFDSDIGPISYTNFTIVENMNMIAANCIGQYFAYYALGLLVGDKSTNEWHHVTQLIATLQDIPIQLPNPAALKFTGAVTGSYDGSVPLTVEIPRGDSIVPAPSSADNGKYLGCKNGAATWMPVEASGGGATKDKWELINEFEIPEGTEESNVLSFTKDSNGNDFSLKKALILARFEPYTGESTIPNFSFASINGVQSGNKAERPLGYTSVWPALSKTKGIGAAYFVDVSGVFWVEKSLKTELGDLRNGKRTFSNTNSTNNNDKEWMAIPNVIGEIHQIGGTNMLIYPGCWFALYGVRA